MDQVIIDQESRFAVTQSVEISTESGWVQATITEVIIWPDNLGIAYKVSYIPLWEKNNKSYFTVVTGLAVR